MNEELRWLALNDRLTNLRNRHYVYEIMPGEMSRLQRRHHKLRQGEELGSTGDFGLALVDLDFFKRVNDAYGQETGDVVLSKIAAVLAEVTRSSDVLARWGGEEFLVLFRDVEIARLRELCERIREAVQARPISVDDDISVTLSCSIGYSHFPIHVDADTYAWEDVAKIADIALSEAKQTGRNRVVGLTYALDVHPEQIMDLIHSDIKSAVDNGYLVWMADSGSDEAAEVT